MANDIYPWRVGVPEEGGEPFVGAAPAGPAPTGAIGGATEAGEVGPAFLTIRPTLPTVYAEPYGPLVPTAVPTAPTGLVITGGTVLFTTPTTATFQVMVADGRLIGGTLTLPYLTGGLMPVGTTIYVTGGTLQLNTPTSGTVVLITGTGVRITGGFVTGGAVGAAPIMPFFPTPPPAGVQVTGPRLTRAGTGLAVSAGWLPGFLFDERFYEWLMGVFAKVRDQLQSNLDDAKMKADAAHNSVTFWTDQAARAPDNVRLQEAAQRAHAAASAADDAVRAARAALDACNTIIGNLGRMREALAAARRRR